MVQKQRLLAHIGLFLVLLFAFGVGFHFFDANNDLWWHLRTGELILDGEGIPTEDPYSFTMGGEPWVAHEWLAEVIFAGMVSLFGLGSLIWCKAGLFILIIFLLYRVMEDEKKPWLVLSLLVLTIAFLQFRLLLRPHLFFWLFLVLELYILRKGKSIFWLIPLFIVWANTHASAILGLFIAGCYGLGRLLQVLKRKQPWKALVPFALLPFALLVNPWTWRIYVFPFEVIGAAKGIITEWEPFPLSDWHLLVFLGLLLVIAVLAIQKRRMRLPDLLPLLVFVPLAFTARRNLPIAMFLLVVALVPLIPRRDVLWGKGTMFGKSVFLLLVIGFGSWFIVDGKAFSPSIPFRSYAFNAMSFINDNGLAGNLFNDYEHGGIVIYEGYPDSKVFIDGRIDLYGPRVFKDYMTLHNLDEGYGTVLDTYAIDAFLLSHGSPLEEGLLSSEDYALVYFDPLVSVFVPIERLPDGLPVFQMLGPLEISSPGSAAETLQLANEMAYLLTLDPGYAEMHKNLGELLIMTGIDAAEGQAHLEEYLRLEPEGPYAQDVKELLSRR